MGRLNPFYLSVLYSMIFFCAVVTEVDALGVFDTGEIEI
jgi:hypothetical protein